MDNFRIKGFEDDSVVNGVGSFFRRLDGDRWFVNIDTFPVKRERSYLTLSQAPVIARQRILNATSKTSKKGFHKSFTITNTYDWQVAKVKNCAAITHHRKGDREQYCFVFKIESGITVYLPQFELARVLFFHDGYLSRTAMMPDILQAEFDVQVNNTTGEASINVMPSSGYKLKHYDEPGCRRVLSWILIDEDVRRSYESIGRYQLLEGKDLGQYRVWDFKFEPPALANTRFSVKGWFNSDSNTMFVHEIQGLGDIPIGVPPTVHFSHPDFVETVSGKGNSGYAAGVERPAQHEVDDEAGAGTDNKTVIIKPPVVELSFQKPINTIKVPQKDRIGSSGKQDNDAPEKASRDVSTDETSTTGELPNADWDNIDDQTDDSHLYLNKFDSFFKMLELLKEKHGCEVSVYPLRKLPKVPRCKKHLLTIDGNPRCLAVVKVISDGVTYHVLEVDTSDTNKPLSTQVIQASIVEDLEGFIENIERELLKSSLSWPKEYISSTIGRNCHFGISHQKSAHFGRLTEEEVGKWACRFIKKLQK
ncbi:transcriptional antiterminator [Thalassomonas viridans]|uniref:Transcriptional antiterminator n=1 Tax=Thalassomonas viridans TaxID=137584 RepID=A0AAF0C951_9GAMM|nr:Tn7-like element transposition protein TnsE [Thalassomonas viridans]WDE05428.1 transcriptional antiterminator [Thalassomonas viridans]